MKHELYRPLLLNPKNISVSQDFTLRARAAVSWWANQDQVKGGGITDFPAWSMAHNNLTEHLWCQKKGYAKENFTNESNAKQKTLNRIGCCSKCSVRCIIDEKANLPVYILVFLKLHNLQELQGRNHSVVPWKFTFTFQLISFDNVFCYSLVHPFILNTKHMKLKLW